MGPAFLHRGRVVGNPQQIFAWAEQAVEGIALDIDPALAGVWRDVTPEAMGLDKDNWLRASRDMIIRFNALASGASISISEPARVKYRTRDLIDFVGLIADAAEQVA